ncbi:MAG: biotin/lipoyl-containing protein [Planctomycetota bacterium]
MKKLRITIGDRSYDVTVEVLEDSPPHVAHPSSSGVPPTAAAPPPQSPPPVATPPAQAPAGSGSVRSPMSGSVTTINVKQGDQVEAGAVLLVLDAMKMENKVVAPASGSVKEVLVKEGDTVVEGQPLFVIQ